MVTLGQPAGHPCSCLASRVCVHYAPTLLELGPIHLARNPVPRQCSHLQYPVPRHTGHLLLCVAVDCSMTSPTVMTPVPWHQSHSFSLAPWQASHGSGLTRPGLAISHANSRCFACLMTAWGSACRLSCSASPRSSSSSESKLLFQFFPAQATTLCLIEADAVDAGRKEGWRADAPTGRWPCSPEDAVVHMVSSDVVSKRWAG